MMPVSGSSVLPPQPDEQTIKSQHCGKPRDVGCLTTPNNRLTGCGKSGILWPDMGYNARCVTRCGGTSDARWRCQERGAVQLFELRSAGAIGSSVAADPEDCGRGAGCSDRGIPEAVRQVRTAVDSA